MSLIVRAIRHAHARGYRVTDDGQVLGPSGRPRKLTTTAIGRTLYHRFTVKFERRAVSITVHRFAGFCKFGEQTLRKGVMVLHGGEHSLDNRLIHFRLGDNRLNMLDMGREYLSERGQRGNRMRKIRPLHYAKKAIA
jgi:hypothetical protein